MTVDHVKVTMILILQLALLTTLATCSLVSSQEFVYYVRPDNDSTGCNTSCHSLMYYTQNTSKYFVSNATFIFLDGFHFLENDTLLAVANVEQIVFRGTNLPLTNDSHTPTIECKGYGQFNFENIISLTLKRLTFIGCGRILSNHEYPTMAAIRLSNITGLHMSEITVQNCTGFGLLAYRIYGESIIRESIFKHNHGTDSYIGGNCAISYTRCDDTHVETIHLKIESSQFMFGRFSQRKDRPFAPGLALYLVCSKVDIVLYNVTMQGNEAMSANQPDGFGGNMAIIYSHHGNHTVSSNVQIVNCTFSHGRAQFGGGLFVHYFSSPSNSSNNRLEINGSTFEYNYSELGGSGISFLHTKRSVNKHYFVQNNFVISDCSFIGNVMSISRTDGVAISFFNLYTSNPFRSAHSSVFQAMINSCSFSDHKTVTGNGQSSNMSRSGVLYLREQPDQIHVKDCNFENNKLSAIVVYRSKVFLEGRINIFNNSAIVGGGLVFCESSYMLLKPHTQVRIANNQAMHVGGGIFAEDQCLQSKSLCFYQIDFPDGQYGNRSVIETINVRLINNSAKRGGNQVFGGSVDTCYHPFNDYSTTPRQFFRKIFSVFNASYDLSPVASDPSEVCFCHSNHTKCSEQTLTGLHVFPGETFTLHVATVGQFNGLVPGSIQAKPNTTYHNKGWNERYYDQHVKGSCSPVNYTVHWTSDHVTIDIMITDYLLERGAYNSKQIEVSLKQCPLGMSLNAENKCDCMKNLTNPPTQVIGCYINNQTVQRLAPYWLGYHHKNNSSALHGTVDGPIFHLCPFDYCLPNDSYIRTSIDKFFQNDQCRPYRTGMYCSKCKSSHSLLLGSSVCYDCSTKTFFHVFAGTLLMLCLGLVIVLFLMFFNLSVSNGTMSGLLFYLNIFETFKVSFVTGMDFTFAKSALLFFSSSLNLDLGFSMCYYHGMDIYQRTWIHYGFCVYVWGIAGLVIVLCKRYSFFARIFGKNAVQILATLFFISYTKINRLVLTSLSSAVISYPSLNDSLIHRRVWLPDGDIEYLNGKHIPLFMAGLIFGVLSLLFTLILLFAQLLQKYSHIRFLRWVNRIKPFIDAYTCPHIVKTKYRFWNGLLLLLRLLLCIYSAVFLNQHNGNVFSAVILLCLFILALTWTLGGIYQKWQLNLLASLSIVNLTVLSVVSLYISNEYPAVNNIKIEKAENEQLTITLSSLGIAALMFFGVTIFHFYQRLRNCQWCRRRRLMRVALYRFGICIMNYRNSQREYVRINTDTRN